MPVLEPQEQKRNKNAILTKNVFTTFLSQKDEKYSILQHIRSKSFSVHVDQSLNPRNSKAGSAPVINLDSLNFKI